MRSNNSVDERIDGVGARPPGFTGRKVAVAIGYTEEDIAPKLLASGKGRTAEEIIAVARKAGVEVIEEPMLAVLMERAVKTGDIIPVWCWEATAKIMAFVFEKGLKNERN